MLEWIFHNNKTQSVFTHYQVPCDKKGEKIRTSAFKVIKSQQVNQVGSSCNLDHKRLGLYTSLMVRNKLHECQKI